MSIHPDDYTCFGNIHPMTDTCAHCPLRRSCAEDTYCERYEEDRDPPEREEDE